MAGNDANTNLLLHCDGIDEATSFPDVSKAEPTHIVTRQGSAQVDTAQKKWGTASCLLDGNSDYLTVPDHADWSFGDGDFTIDLQLRFNAIPADGQFDIVVSQAVDGSNRWLLYFAGAASGGLRFGEVGGAVLDFGQGSWDGWSTDTWYHVAIVRDGNEWDVYRNGVSLGNTTDAGTMASLAADLWIGQQNIGGSDYFDGWFDEIRVSKGIARWPTGSPFTPPTKAYSVVAKGNFLPLLNT